MITSTAHLTFYGLILSALCLPLTHIHAATQVTFEIEHYEVSGNSLLPASVIDQTLQKYTGKNSNFETVQQAMEALELRFHEHGFKLVSISLMEQELNHGVVKLQVNNLHLGSIKVQGNRWFTETNILRSLPVLEPGSTPNMDEVSEALKFANQHPAKNLTMKLKNAINPDAVDVFLDVSEQSPWKHSFNIDNAGQDQTGKTNLSVSLQYANLWERDHIVSFQYATTAEKPRQISVYGASYHLPLYQYGSSIDFYGNYSNVDSGSVKSGPLNFDITGKGTIFGLRYNLPKLTKKDSHASLIIGLDVKTLQNSVLLSALDLGSEMTLRPLSINYVDQWPLAEGNVSGSITFLKNIPGGKNGQASDFSSSRTGASAHYSILRYSLSYARSFSSDLQARFLLNGQYTRNALVASEQFGSGGANSVRGFAERAIVNDSGNSFNAELYSPNFCTTQQQWSCRLLGFYDVAYTRRNLPLAGEISHAHIASAGLGVRISFGPTSTLQIDYGHALKSSIAGLSDKNRLHARMNFSY